MVARSKGEEEPSRLVQMTEMVRVYMGAWLDSDGSVTHRHGKIWGITVSGTEIEHIASFLRLMQVGSVSFTPYRPSNQYGTKPLWRWSIQRRAEVRDFLAHVSPYSIKAQSASV